MLIFVKRMVEEEKDLKGKIKRAEDFLNTNVRISKTERELLEEQIKYMKQYLEVLRKRLDLYKE